MKLNIDRQPHSKAKLFSNRTCQNRFFQNKNFQKLSKVFTFVTDVFYLKKRILHTKGCSIAKAYLS